MQSNFWAEYVRAYLLGGKEEVVGDAAFVFTDTVLANLHAVVMPEALATPLVFTERLSNAVLAVCIGFRDNSQLIAINARVKADPEILAHTLVEEFAHAQQRIDGVDFKAQRSQFAYHERPYEQEAKRIATTTLGYEPDTYDNLLIREEPGGILLDRL